MKTLRCLLLFLPACAHAQVQLDAPKGGWRNTAGEDTQYTQTVNYPASSVNSQPGQSETAMIRGDRSNVIERSPAATLCR